MPASTHEMVVDALTGNNDINTALAALAEGPKEEDLT